jgi:hypothetical protein
MKFDNYLTEALLSNKDVVFVDDGGHAGNSSRNNVVSVVKHVGSKIDVLELAWRYGGTDELLSLIKTWLNIYDIRRVYIMQSLFSNHIKTFIKQLLTQEGHSSVLVHIIPQPAGPSWKYDVTEFTKKKNQFKLKTFSTMINKNPIIGSLLYNAYNMLVVNSGVIPDAQITAQ